MLNLLQNANNVMLPVKDWWNRKRSENIKLNPTEVLYAEYKPESNSFHT